jgi:uncharacterized cupredoxin-like copper-binding protein
MNNHRLTAVLLGSISAVAIAACGGSSGSSSDSSSTPSTPSSPSSSGGAITVKESEFKLDPSNATVAMKGGAVTITATNDGKFPHALALEKAGPAGQDLKTSTIQPGASAKLTATLKPGTYEWYCPIDGHKDLGMKGEITVK